MSKKHFVLGTLLLLLFLSIGSSYSATDVLKVFQSGTYIGSVDAINCSTNLTCNIAGNRVHVVSSAGGGGAPLDATYITQTANASLSNEQALSALGTGLVKNTTTTGVLSIYGGLNCPSNGSTGLRAYGISADGTPLCDYPLLTNALGVLAVSKGGTGATSATADNVMVGDGTNWNRKALPSCTDSGGQHLNYDTSTDTFSCGTTSNGSASNWTTTRLTSDTSTSSSAASGVAIPDISIPCGTNTAVMTVFRCTLFTSAPSTTVGTQIQLSWSSGSPTTPTWSRLSCDTTTGSRHFNAAADNVWDATGVSSGQRCTEQLEGSSWAGGNLSMNLRTSNNGQTVYIYKGSYCEYRTMP